MRYENELRKIRQELGENTKVIELAPNKQIVINLEEYGQAIDLSSKNPSTLMQDANQVNSLLNSMYFKDGT